MAGSDDRTAYLVYTSLLSALGNFFYDGYKRFRKPPHLSIELSRPPLVPLLKDTDDVILEDGKMALLGALPIVQGFSLCHNGKGFLFSVVFCDTADWSHLHHLEVALGYPALLSVKFHHHPPRRCRVRGGR